MSLYDIYKQACDEKRENSNYVKLEEGSPFTGELVSVENIVNKFGDPSRRYIFNTASGQKTLENGSFRLIDALMKVKAVEGDVVEISKTGERFETQYSVKVTLKNGSTNESPDRGRFSSV